MDTGTVIILAMFIIFLGLLFTGYFLIKKHYESGIKELKMHYEDIIEETRKETERKMRELWLKESIEVKHTIIDTNQYDQSIIMDAVDIQGFEKHPEDLQKLLRFNFAEAFAKNVIAPNLVINEVADVVPHKKKYFTKVHIGF